MKPKTFLQGFTLITLAVIFSCSPQREATRTVERAEVKPAPMVKPETIYYIYEDNEFKVGKLDKEPVSIEGEPKFLSTMYRGIRYPPEAREGGVGGTVMITVIINEFGQLERSSISKRIGSGCDEEALAAVRRGFQLGFEPAMLNGKAVKVKYDIPVNFRLE